MELISLEIIQVSKNIYSSKLTLLSERNKSPLRLIIPCLEIKYLMLDAEKDVYSV